MASPPSVSSPSSGPPFYVLVSHAALSNASSAFPTSPASLGHPIIQYHYADDSPLALLPQYAGERVLVLDYDPISTTPSAKSISDAVAVMGVKVTDAPGVGVADGGPGNTKMYLIETISIGRIVSPSAGQTTRIPKPYLRDSSRGET